MNIKIIGSVVLGSVLLAMQPAAIAGKCMTIGVATKDGSECMSMGNAVIAETGTDGFRDAVSAALGDAAASRAEGCTGAHVSIEPFSDQYGGGYGGPGYGRGYGDGGGNSGCGYYGGGPGYGGPGYGAPYPPAPAQ